MSTPATPPQPLPSPPQMAQQDVNQGAQQAQTSQLEELRALATTLQQPELTFDPATLRKGIITATSIGPPPTISLLLSGDTTTTIDGVRQLDSYSPVVGQTVLLVKQGTELLAIGHIDDGVGSSWTQASLSSGFSHNGDSNGNLFYRKVVDRGTAKLQWKGGVGHSNSNTLVTTVPTGFRPSSKRTLIAARENFEGGGSVAVKVEFQTNGQVVLDGTTARPSVTDLQTNAVAVTHAHSHGGSANPTSFSETHTHNITGTLTVEEPEWVSFNGLEYFLE